MLIDGVPITPAVYVRDLWIYLDRDLSIRTHVQRTVSRCFAALRQLRQIRHSVPAAIFQTLVVALVHSRLDYGNSVLVGIPVYLMRRLQSVLNAAARRARLIFHLRRSDRISDALVCLHWLRVWERIEFKTAVLTYKVLCGAAPRYLGPLNRIPLIWPTDVLSALLPPIVWLYHHTYCLLLAAELFRLPPPRSGTHCQTTSSLQHPYSLFDAI